MRFIRGFARTAKTEISRFFPVRRKKVRAQITQNFPRRFGKFFCAHFENAKKYAKFSPAVFKIFGGKVTDDPGKLPIRDFS